MATLPQAPKPVRARLVLLLIPVVLVGIGGCRHRRSSMRPVYVSPAPAAIVEPSPSFEAEAPLNIEPASPRLDPPTELEPVAPPADSAVVPSARPIGPDEPELREPDRGSLRPVPDAPALNGPQASRSPYSAPRRAASNRDRRYIVQTELRSMVNDPQDLFSPPKADRPWRYIVVHHSSQPAGNYDQIDAEHRRVLGLDGCGYHFIIGNGTGSPDGQIEVSSRWSNQKAGVHCRDARDQNVSEYGIGICLVGDLDQGPPTAKQLAAARSLITYLSQRYEIPAARISSHNHVAAREVVCPGRYLSIESILAPRSVALR